LERGVTPHAVPGMRLGGVSRGRATGYGEPGEGRHTSGRGLLSGAPPGLEGPGGVEGVPQPVSDIVHGENDEADHQAGEERHVRGEIQVVLGIV
jgi:hypothetical protein